MTQDALVEGVHFRFDLLSWRELGYRAAAVGLSDLAASGADPIALVVSLAAPSLDHAIELYEGLNEPGVPIRGGDTTRGDSVVLSVTARGTAHTTAVAARGGPSPRRRRPRDARPLRRPRAGRAAHRRALACRLVIDLARVLLAEGATRADLEFGEDYELLAATPDPLDLTVIGRCEKGSGVNVALGGWEHFG